jgi:N-acetylglucosamine kinase-like BadF-type ATPase
MILIADSGSTKANWCLVKQTGKKVYFKTEGYNPHFVKEDYIIKSLKKNFLHDVELSQVEKVHFYGSGCMAGKSIVVERALGTIFNNAKVNVAVDLLAAARALLGKDPGFAAILGTGTNSCIYNGKKITQNINSLGYMLGDEGSGSYIGKKLLRDYLRGYMPEAVNEEFSKIFGLSFDNAMDQVYTQPFPNRFCAGFTKFAGDHTDIPYLYDIVKQSFRDFFNNLVSRYPDYRKYTFNCSGSVGYNFSTILKEVANEFGMQTKKIISSPMDELVEYHMQIQDGIM